MSVDQKYQYMTAEQSVAEKQWASGSSEQIESKEFIIRKDKQKYIGEYKKIIYPPSLYKMIDELLVNAIDHLIRQLGTAKPVTTIKVWFDKNGRCKIYNDGQGVECEIHKTASEKLGRTIYVPTLVFGILFQGSNRTKDDSNIVGGENGLGGKIANILSNEFIVETVRDEKYFIQRWRNHKEIEEEPKIIDLTKPNQLSPERKIEHTTLSFVPDYKGIFKYESFTSELYETLIDLIRTRVFFASAYGNFIVNTHINTKNCPIKQKIDFYFNDELLNVRSISDIAKLLFPDDVQVNTQIIPIVNPKAKTLLSYNYTWDVSIVIANTSNFDYAYLSNVNGIIVRDGKHLKHILNQVTSGVKEKITKVFNDKNLSFSSTYISGNVFILANTAIPRPAWTSQRKDILDTDIKKFIAYELDPKIISQLADLLKDQIIDKIFSKKSVDKTVKPKRNIYDKYHKAKYANGTPKQRAQCTLIAVEGDSAMSQVELGVSHNLGWDNFGVITLGGVIVNARRECTVIETITSKYIKKSNKLINNEFMNVLLEVTGLDPESKYDSTSTTYKKEMSKLSYGNITACVDQDLDGKGNILGLILSTFELFWPTLLRAGYIKWFCSPIVRLYPKSGGKVIPFYNIQEFESWQKNSKNNVGKYNVRYYKGLGTHSRDETIHMFKSFRENVFTYYMDTRSHELFEIYFGDDSDLRKKELSQTTKTLSLERVTLQQTTKMISCSDHLECDTNLYQKDNLERKLDHIIDGQNQAGRKILDGLMKVLTGNKEMKVEDLVGHIIAEEHYHHGGASLALSITGKGLITPGGKQLPIIIPQSFFGSRKEGGSDAASPRYIKATLNKKILNLIFPRVDYWILPFNFDEGLRSEPKYFAPIIPMVILESAELPSHGWKLKLWARDIFKVIENIKRLITLSDDAPLLKLPPTTYKGTPYEWNGSFKSIRGDLYSFGNYSFDATQNTIHITELPLRVWTKPYLTMLRKKQQDDLVISSEPDDILDASDDIKVNITIRLKSGAIEILNNLGDSIFTDGIEEYFLLRDRMDSNINLMGMSGEVLSFSNYEDVMYVWFLVRKNFYRQRLDRQLLMLELEIKYYENIIKFIEIYESLNLVKQSISNMENKLLEKKFDKFHKKKYSNPKFTPNAELISKIMLSDKANYDYLLDLKEREKSSESLIVFKNNLQNAIDHLSDLQSKYKQGRFPGACDWLYELDQLADVIKLGQQTFWKFEDAEKFQL